VRFVVHTLGDLVYGVFAEQLTPQVATTHPMKYLLTLPEQGARSSSSMRPRACVIAIDGSDQAFAVTMRRSFARAGLFPSP
jgi:hypothetical protein